MMYWVTKDRGMHLRANMFSNNMIIAKNQSKDILRLEYTP